MTNQYVALSVLHTSASRFSFSPDINISFYSFDVQIVDYHEHKLKWISLLAFAKHFLHFLGAHQICPEVPV